MSEAITKAAQEAISPELQRMTAHRAVFFLERFKKEEKMLGPNEQAALDFAMAALSQAGQALPNGLTQAETDQSASVLGLVGQGGQGEAVAWEVTRMGREPEVMTQAEFTRRSFDTGRFRPLVYGDAAQPAPVPAPVAPASSACPICGVATPHGHTKDQVFAYLKAQAWRFLASEVHIEIGSRQQAIRRMLDESAQRNRDEAAHEECRKKMCEAYADGCENPHDRAVPAPVASVAMPCTDDEIDAATFEIFASDHPDVAVYDRAIWRAAEAHHRIGQQPAAAAPAVPAGWQLVPVEASMAMLDAGWGICGGDGCASAEPNRKKINAARHSFRDLLSAAPKPAGEEGQ